ncbi:hypothetical protein KIN20_021130 [Parelaphostrongylus tenuis]|uniref:Uncharacterized protein n=1 Tax=Parelaphostrongylus tenuis TaxID=148309 RepID=A0AAD5MTQ5_PARTN|nr:hypothetical protein KIN20_021130 [Parelaphostrongylus tenuis]
MDDSGGLCCIYRRRNKLHHRSTPSSSVMKEDIKCHEEHIVFPSTKNPKKMSSRTKTNFDEAMIDQKFLLPS